MGGARHRLKHERRQIPPTLSVGVLQCDRDLGVPLVDRWLCYVVLVYPEADHAR